MVNAKKHVAWLVTVRFEAESVRLSTWPFGHVDDPGFFWCTSDGLVS